MTTDNEDSMSTTSTRTSTSYLFSDIEYLGYPDNIDPSLFPGIDGVYFEDLYERDQDELIGGENNSNDSSSHDELFQDCYSVIPPPSIQSRTSGSENCNISANPNNSNPTRSINNSKALGNNRDINRGINEPYNEPPKGNETIDLDQFGSDKLNPKGNTRTQLVNQDIFSLTSMPRASQLYPKLSVGNINQYLLELRIKRLMHLCQKRKARLDSLRSSASEIVKESLQWSENKLQTETEIDKTVSTIPNNGQNPNTPNTNEASNSKFTPICTKRADFLRQKRTALIFLNEEINVISQKYLDNLAEIFNLQIEIAKLGVNQLYLT
ncbi:hypothetical protein BB560_002138 [Smittium megazygosporum]|uniref:Uncharacterized protein n=1 Tax=Smittium megazygosporum TaxID=133381 RepID=A0A2T9ZFN2_9FUNG|nr:hypothetical protein BB560_002138 [Smittium megazygosporum]